MQLAFHSLSEAILCVSGIWKDEHAGRVSFRDNCRPETDIALQVESSSSGLHLGVLWNSDNLANLD
jgi:hypothetical protein